MAIGFTQHNPLTTIWRGSASCMTLYFMVLALCLLSSAATLPACGGCNSQRKTNTVIVAQFVPYRPPSQIESSCQGCMIDLQWVDRCAHDNGVCYSISIWLAPQFFLSVYYQRTHYQDCILSIVVYMLYCIDVIPNQSPSLASGCRLWDSCWHWRVFRSSYARHHLSAKPIHSVLYRSSWRVHYCLTKCQTRSDRCWNCVKCMVQLPSLLLTPR